MMSQRGSALKKVPIHLQSAQTRILIKNGRVINDDQSFVGDVYMEDGLIKQVGQNLSIPGGTRTIDARGKLVMPGGMDANTHLQLPFMGAETADDFYSGTKAALAGGTTTIIDCVMDKPGVPLLDAYDKWLAAADSKACCDFGLRVAITSWDPDVTPGEMDELCKARGVNTFVVYTTYKGTYMLKDDELYAIFRKVKELGCLAQVVAENGDLVELKAKEIFDSGVTGPEGHLLARPENVEGEAVNRVITIANQANCPLYVTSVLSKTTGDLISKARQEGSILYGETLVAGLAVDGQNYFESDWIKAAQCVSVPPLRPDPTTKSHLAHLIESGDLQVVSSNHSPFSLADRGIGKDDFRLIPHGLHGVEERMQIIWETLVNTGEISLCQFVAITSTNAAKLTNVYPMKGRVCVGADADILIWDTTKTKTISAKTHHQKTDFNLFEGMTCKGSPIVIISGGKPIFEDGELHVSQGVGRFVEMYDNNPLLYSRVHARDKVGLRQSLPANLPEKIKRNHVNLPERPSKSQEVEQDILKHPSEKGTGLDDTKVDRKAKIRVQEPPGGKTSLGFLY